MDYKDPIQVAKEILERDLVTESVTELDEEVILEDLRSRRSRRSRRRQNPSTILKEEEEEGR